MEDQRHFEYFLLRYVPNALRDEGVNIGLVMTERAVAGGFVGVHFTKDLERVRRLDPNLDVEWIEALGREIKGEMADSEKSATLVSKMSDSFSNMIQISPVWRLRTANPAQEMKYLAATLVEMDARGESSEERVEKKNGAQWIRSQMSKEFKKAGIWELVTKNLPAAPYSLKGDPLKFDFAYAVGFELKMFQAIPLMAKPENAVAFALHYGKIAPTIAQVRAQTPVLTAVVEDAFDPGNPSVAFATELMKGENIRVARLHEMPRIAQAARRELMA